MGAEERRWREDERGREVEENVRGGIVDRSEEEEGT